MFSTLQRDIQAVRDRDPASRSWLEAVLCYPGVHAVWGHRASRWLWGNGFHLPARMVLRAQRLVAAHVVVRRFPDAGG